MHTPDFIFASNADQTLYDLLSVEIITQIQVGEDEEALVELADALVCAPALAIAILYDHAQAHEAVRAMHQRVNGHALLGMSGIESAEDVSVAVEAGAQFLLSADFRAGVLAEARRQDILYLPGVFSTREVSYALDAGARALFLFPADIFGPGHLQALHKRYPQAFFFPGVNIHASELGAYAAAGAAAAVVTLSPLHSPDWRQADIITYVRKMLQQWRAGLVQQDSANHT